MKKIVCLILALWLVALALSGCVSVSLTTVKQQGDVDLPLPQDSVPSAPSGDSRTERTERVTFYSIATDQQQLTQVTRTLRLNGDETLIGKTIERLLASGITGNVSAMVPGGTRLEWYEFSQGVVTLSLSPDTLALDGQTMIWLRAALANTLTGLPGVSWVNVLIGGREETAFRLPTGALRQNDGNLTAMWAQQMADDDRFFSDPEGSQIEREVPLYFASWLDNRLLPEVRRVTFASDNIAQKILSELHRGPIASGNQAHAVIPEKAKLMRAPEIVTLEDGRRVLRISFAQGLYELLEQDNLTSVQLFSSLALTLCRFIPELDGLMVGVGGELVTQIDNGIARIYAADGVITPELFDDAVGRIAKLYFTGEDGMLCEVERVLDMESAVSPRTLMEQLIEGPYVFDSGARAVVPDGVTTADLIGVRVLQDETALINWSSNFYRLCQGLDAAQERNLVYAIVNTLTALDEINQVRFYIGGEVVDTLAHTIYLRGSLMANPGLVRRQILQAE